MSVATIDAERVKSAVKAVIEDWVSQHDDFVDVSGSSLRGLYKMLVDRLKSIHVKDEPQIRVLVVPKTASTKSYISVYLPKTHLKCVAIFTATPLVIWGQVTASSEKISASGAPESQMELVCGSPIEIDETLQQALKKY